MSPTSFVSVDIIFACGIVDNEKDDDDDNDSNDCNGELIIAREDYYWFLLFIL